MLDQSEKDKLNRILKDLERRVSRLEEEMETRKHE